MHLWQSTLVEGDKSRVAHLWKSALAKKCSCGAGLMINLEYVAETELAASHRNTAQSSDNLK